MAKLINIVVLGVIIDKIVKYMSIDVPPKSLPSSGCLYMARNCLVVPNILVTQSVFVSGTLINFQLRN